MAAATATKIESLTNLDKAAVLLRALSQRFSEQVLVKLPSKEADRLRSVMNDVAKRSDLGTVTQLVMREFQELRRRATGTDGSSAVGPMAHSSAWIAQQYQASQVETGASNSGEATSNADEDESEIVQRLAKINPLVMSKVLQAEPPRVLLLVLQQLPSDKSAAVLKRLPEDVRSDTITAMSVGVTFPDVIVERVLTTIVQQCDAHEDVVEEVSESDAQIKMMVGILQSLDREERMRLMVLLTEQNEDVATKIDDNLYDYTDLLRIEDRSLQRILTQTDQKTLATALKTAPDPIKDKVMKNMSERVRAALAEEMEFLSSVPPAKAEEARKAITAVIRTQDKEGALVWIETPEA